MDKEFDTINQMYLTQQFVDDSEEEHQVEECRSMIRAYAFAENAIVSMGDNKLNCSYCYFGGLADVLGLAREERQDVIPSLYEGFIYNRADADDLAHRHADEVAFVHMIKPLSIKESRFPSPIQISIIASVLCPNVPNTPILSVDQPQN